jgi:hypothetical protein
MNDAFLVDHQPEVPEGKAGVYQIVFYLIFKILQEASLFFK